MAINTIGSSNSDFYTQLSSATPANLGTAVNFTSLGLHRKFMLVFREVGFTASGTCLIRVNNDSAVDQYILARVSDNFASSNVSIAGATGFGTHQGSATGVNDGFLILRNCDTTSAHFVESGSFESATSATRSYYVNGYYKAAAVVSQLNVVMTASTFNGTGTITLFGAP